MRCVSPISLTKTRKSYGAKVPCGKCYACRNRRIAGWAFRLQQEGRSSRSAHFVTMTYDADHIPLTMNGYADLSKRDCQLYLKRIRKAMPGIKIKYYLCSEYGEKSFRPHYHMIIFNASEDVLTSSWTQGHVHIGKVSQASINYVMKYMAKPSQIPLHETDDRNQEFSLMSKRLGSGYLTPEMIRWHRSDVLNRCYLHQDGLKIPMPRYYKEKIYTKRELTRIGEHLLTTDPDNIDIHHLMENNKDVYQAIRQEALDEINTWEAVTRKQNKRKRLNSKL